METSMKARSRRTVKASLSFDADLLCRAKKIAADAGYRFSFSAYVNNLVEKDVQCRLEPRKFQLVSTGI